MNNNSNNITTKTARINYSCHRRFYHCKASVTSRTFLLLVFAAGSLLVDSSSFFNPCSPASRRAAVAAVAFHHIPTTTNKKSRTSRMTKSLDTDEREGLEKGKGGPVWDPIQQIYVGGVIPGDNAEVEKLIKESDGCLRIFGYGSLCWNAGPVGQSALAHPSVKHSILGRVTGYRRCWAQKSTDHRGNPNFPGIVCTLLTDDEYRRIILDGDGGTKTHHEKQEEESITEGLLYEVPPELVDECLAELDFREKGGYARDVINVVKDESGETVRALLYRGTPDNPAIWPRALRDLPFAAAVMAVAIGPSGKNEIYLNRLDRFLEDSACPKALQKFDDTFELTRMVNEILQNQYQLFFLHGCGSNQHNQLLLNNSKGGQRENSNNDDDDDDGDAHEMTEIVALVQPTLELEQQQLNGDSSSTPLPDLAVKIYAGGGHSGILTRSGRLFLFGWNDSGQLGTSGFFSPDTGSPPPLPLGTRLGNIQVHDAALGFSHTLVIEENSGRLYAFGDNSKGQVCGTTSSAMIIVPTTPDFLKNETIVAAAAGLFHSAVITRDGDLITFGYAGAGTTTTVNNLCSGVGRWKPPLSEHDGSVKLVKVACGRRHTVMLDDRGRIWSFGKDNKYGQLGRSTDDNGDKQRDPSVPQLVTSVGITFHDIQCGWSHTVALGNGGEGNTVVYGWGRNDKGQLGTGTTDNIQSPTRLFPSHQVQTIACGSESTTFLDENDNFWSCGWNEHGNLATGPITNYAGEDCLLPTKAIGATKVVRPSNYPDNDESCRTCIAAGGAHVLAMKVLSVFS